MYAIPSNQVRNVMADLRESIPVEFQPAVAIALQQMVQTEEWVETKTIPPLNVGGGWR